MASVHSPAPSVWNGNKHCAFGAIYSFFFLGKKPGSVPGGLEFQSVFPQTVFSAALGGVFSEQTNYLFYNVATNRDATVQHRGSEQHKSLVRVEMRKRFSFLRAHRSQS